MAYRMKRNGAGLASICILLTMILVMMSSTSALYTGADQCLNVRYPNEIGAFACKYGYDEDLEQLGKKLDEDLKSVAKEHGAVVTNNKTYYQWSVSGYFDNSKLDITLNSKSNLAFVNYDKVAQIIFIDVDVYNRVFGYNETVAPGEALVGTAKKIPIGEVMTIGDIPFKVTKRIDDRIGEIDPAAVVSASPGIYMIVNDANNIAKNYVKYTDYDGEPMLAWFWDCRFDTGLDESGQIELAETLDRTIRSELEGLGFSNMYCESHEAERGDFVGTFGGLFFLGIMLSIIFLVSCVVIMYYKQVSEGFEDQARFGIMQKVGMTREEIRKSIDSQMLTVFAIPIIFACIHLAVVLPIVNKLLMLCGGLCFDLRNALCSHLQTYVECILQDRVLGLHFLLGPEVLPLPVAITLGAIASATAPAATLMVVRQYKAKGPVTDLLLPIVALDDAVGLVVFSVSFGIAQAIAGGTLDIVSVIIDPLLEIVFSLILGAIMGTLLTVLEKLFFSNSNRLSLTISFVIDGIERVRARRRREDRVFPASGLHDAGNSILQFQRVLRGYHGPLLQMDSSALRAFLRAVRRGAGPGRFPVSCDHIDRCRIYSYEVHRQIYRRAAWQLPYELQ